MKKTDKSAICICASIFKNQLARSRAAFASIAADFPTAHLNVLILDGSAGENAAAPDPFEITLLEALGIPHLENFCSQFQSSDLREACKPYLFTHLFKRLDPCKLIYVNPETMSGAEVAHLSDLLDSHPFILAPRAATIDGATRPIERLGGDTRPARGNPDTFVGLKSDPSIDSLLTLWREAMCRAEAMPEPDRTAIVRQWLDVAPAFVEGSHIVRNGHAPEKTSIAINLSGHFESEKGVGEGSRALARAVKEAGIQCVFNNWIDPGSANRDQSISPFVEGNPHFVNVMHANAEELRAMVESHGYDYIRGHYNIGVWNWELSTFPDFWMHAFDYLDEVWAPSQFTQASIASVAPVPVYWMPYAVEPPTHFPSHVTRWLFGIPAAAFVFLLVFDFHSYLERKNPLAAVRAFRKAFEDRDDVCLVVKTVHAADAPDERKALLQACGERPNIRIIDAVLARDEIEGFINLCDCYVSLHRSEGFGLPLYEAMSMGKPVIATRYSANVDFMNDENSLLVDFRLIEIEKDRGPYRKGAEWADADVDHAARQMRRVADDRAFARALGSRARAHIVDNLSSSRIGARVAERLSRIQPDTPLRIPRDAPIPDKLRDSAYLLNRDDHLKAIEQAWFYFRVPGFRFWVPRG